VVICLERGADLHMAQLMPLPLTVSCFSKIQIGLPFWYRLTWVVLDKGQLNGCVCVCVCVTDSVRTAPTRADPTVLSRRVGQCELGLSCRSDTTLKHDGVGHRCVKHKHPNIIINVRVYTYGVKR